MGRSVKEPLHANVPERVRREELIRPAERRRDFPKREAQRRLQQKERHWAPIAYAVFLVAVLLIFGFSYTTYAFSKYRGEILPGTHVDQIDVGGMTEKQASKAISVPVVAGHLVPVQLVYQNFKPWEPTRDDLGLGYLFDATAKQAMLVGRTGSVVAQLIDRLPLHPSHDVPLLYNYDDNKIREYIRMHIVTALSRAAVNARLARSGNDFVIVPASDGTQLDVQRAIGDIHSVLGSLTTHTIPLNVIHLHPSITNADVVRVRRTVERFLNHTPVINVGKRVFVTTRASFVPMLTFSEQNGRGKASIVMTVDPNKVHAYVSSLASQIDRPAENAKLVFDAGQVQVVRPLQMGRTLDQDQAYNAILAVVKGLRPNARLRFHVTVSKPPVDQSNPASLGITTLLGTGVSSFPQAGPGRLADVTKIAQALNNTEIPPDGDISFNTLVTPNWDSTVYTDRERDANGTPVPADSGAMQQVATTFLRALYNSGLTLLERHAHNHRLPWYEPPVGLDAVVSPARNWDLRFANNTHKYLLIETRVEPIRQEIYIYVYGPKLGWHVSVTNGKVLKEFRHGPQVVQQDPSLAPGDVQQISWPHNGADVMVQRTITYPNGNVTVGKLLTTYQPSQAIVAVGAAPNPTPTPTIVPATPAPAHARTTPTASPTPGPTATPTFNH